MTVAEIGDTTGDTGTGAGDTVKETQRDSTMRTAQYLVADEVVTLVEETGTTAEAAVHNGGMVQTHPPPNQDGQKIGGGGQNCREGGSSR